MNRRRLERRVEEAVAGTLAVRHRTAVAEHLRADEQARARYDRVIDAYRVLADAPIAPVELELVDQWLFDDMPETVAEPSPDAAPFWTRFLGVFAAVAAAVLLVVGPLRPEADDVLRPKGGAAAPLSIDALCSGPNASSRGLSPAIGGCPRTGTLAFAYRVETERARVLTLFGIDEDGNVKYYAPTPVDPEAIVVEPGGWRPVSFSTQLAVNHRVGRIRLFALLSPRPPTVPEIDALAEAVAALPTAGPADPPWHRRLSGVDALSSLCGTQAVCESAELTFNVLEDPS